MDGSGVHIDGSTLQRGSGSPYDIGFQGSSGTSVTNTHTTTGAAPRIRMF